MKIWLLRTPVLVLLALLFGWQPSIYGQTAPKAIVLAWDGTVPSYIHDLLREGKLPNLAKLIEGGAVADDVIPVFPSLTAPGFASLWTGAPPRITGISGNRVPREPRDQSTILESSSGFNPSLLRAEPLWMAAQGLGRRVLLSHVPFGGERSEFGVYFQGYAGVFGRDRVVTSRSAMPRSAANWVNLPISDKPPLEIQFTIGASNFFGLLIDDPSEAQPGYDTLLVAGTRDGKNIKARLKGGLAKVGGSVMWSGVIDVKTPNDQRVQTYLRLFELKADGSDFLLYHTMLTRETVSPPYLLTDARAEVGAFIGNGAGQLYTQGALGATIPKGGSGIAEIRYLETVAFAQRQLMQTNSWALKNLPWDLFFAYTPFPDEAEHRWRGYLDPSLSGAARELADRFRPFLEEVYRSCDDFLGLLMANRPENTVLALVSDHGIEGVNKLFAINRVLQKGGLLATDVRGRLDLAKTKALYPSINNGYLLINSTDRKNGIVTREQRTELVGKIRDLLFAIRDGDRQVVTAIYDAETDGEAMGIGGPSGGDIYVDLLPGYEFDATTSAGDFIARREPYGTHAFNSLRPSMRTLMVFNGPGVAAGRKLKDVKIIDFAPTLARLLGIPMPKDATGRVLEEAFSNSR